MATPSASTAENATTPAIPYRGNQSEAEALNDSNASGESSTEHDDIGPSPESAQDEPIGSPYENSGSQMEEGPEPQERGVAGGTTSRQQQKRTRRSVINS